MDINTTDETGMVVLPVHSNNVSIDANQPSSKSSPNGERARPVFDLDVVQTIDTREIEKGESPNLIFEVMATGRGMVPELEQLLDKLDGALEGYQVSREKIEAEPIAVNGVTTGKSNMMMFGGNAPEESDTYVDADEDGMFRLPTTRKWKIVFEPTGSAQGKELLVPQLAAGLDGAIKTERYVDMDLVSVEGQRFALKDERQSLVPWLVGGGLVALVVLVLLWVVFGEGQDAVTQSSDALRLPQEVTPFSAVMTLRRFAQQYISKLSSDDYNRLVTETGQLEQRYFGENASSDPQEARDVLSRWHRKLAAK